MAKITILFLLALIAVQYAEFASISNRFGNGETIKSLQDISIGDMIAYLEDLAEQTNEIVVVLNLYFPFFLQDFQNKTNSIRATVNITEYITVFRQEILYLTGDNGENDPKNCGAEAQRTVDLIAVIMTDDVNNCETSVQLVVDKINDLLEFKKQKALKLKQEISMVGLKCMENNDDDKILKCLIGEAKYYNNQVGELVDEIVVAYPIILSTTSHGIEAFGKCMDETNNQASWHSVSMIGMLEGCMHS